MMIELYNANDWQNVKKNLLTLCNQHPEFKYDSYRLITNIEKKVKELCILDIELKKNKDSIPHKRKRKKKIHEINHYMRTISNMALIATLAK